MKKFVAAIVSAVIAAVAFIGAPTATAAPASHPSASRSSSWVSKVPVNLVVEQTATLADGRTVTVYYQKNGDLCEVYTEADLKGYGVDDLLTLRSTSFRVVGAVKGRRVYHTTVAQARKIIKRMVNTYL